MMIAVALLAAALPVALDAKPIARLYERVQLRGGLLYLSDAADLSGLPAQVRRQAEMLILGRYARRTGPQSISGGVVFSRARAMMPLLSQWLPTESRGTLTLFSDDRDEAADLPPSCLTVVMPVQAGMAASGRYFTSGACVGAYRSGVFRYDRHRQAVIAAQDLTQGEQVRAFAGAADRGVQPGERLTLRAGVGPVIVERDVEALQGARPGQRLFVKTNDGEVIAIPLMDLSR